MELPKTVYSTGGRFGDANAAETPDTQQALFDFDNLLVSIEMTLFTPYILKSDGELRNNDIFPHWMQNSTRIEIYGTKAMMVVGRMGGGWQVFVRSIDQRQHRRCRYRSVLTDIQPSYRDDCVDC